MHGSGDGAFRVVFHVSEKADEPPLDGGVHDVAVEVGYGDLVWSQGEGFGCREHLGGPQMFVIEYQNMR